MTTQIVVEAGTGRQRVRLQPGLLRGQVTANGADGCQIGLVATTALLLGGDTVELVVEIGPAAVLDLFEVAGTVAYHGRGRPAAWHTTISIAEGGQLRYRGEPFVVADGSDVNRNLVIALTADARCVLRETLVLGREGETGGRLRSLTRAYRDGHPIWLEEHDLDPDGIRSLPGVLGAARVMDSLVSLGPRPDTVPHGPVSYRLAEDAGTVQRLLADDLAGSPLNAWPGKITSGR